MSRWDALSDESRDTFWRSLRALNATRVVIAVVLLVYLSYDSRSGRATGQAVYAQACIAYLVLAVLFGLATVHVRRRFLSQLVVQIAIDLAVISLLYLAAGGARSGLVILYLFPLAGAAILAPLPLALLAASLVTLFLLAETGYQLLLREGDTPLMQAGLYGAAFFAIVLAVNRLAAKLIGQEELASRRGADLKTEQAINAIVIADVGDGILVLGRDGRVFTGNPAARRMLGLSEQDSDFKLGDMAALEPVAAAFAAWLLAPAGQAEGGAARAAFVTLKPYQDRVRDGQSPAWHGRRELSVHLRLRFARVDARVDAQGGARARCVMFLQDVTAIEDQAQQLKLASMGRLTASIAHEVRNPLSAIGHATALLAEEARAPADRRLLKIVGDNVLRVNRMVEDILQLSRKVQPNGEPVQLAGLLGELCAEFQESHALAGDIVQVGEMGAGAVRFDGLHLREVLVNLLTNAIRYASGRPGSIRIDAVGDDAGRIELHVQDDGPGITPEVRAHLFEPFYTTSSKGTGLGLYLARELCLNNEAKLDYEYRFDAAAVGPHKASGRFVITFAQPPAA